MLENKDFLQTNGNHGDNDSAHYVPANQWKPAIIDADGWTIVWEGSLDGWSGWPDAFWYAIVPWVIVNDDGTNPGLGSRSHLFCQ